MCDLRRLCYWRFAFGKNSFAMGGKDGAGTDARFKPEESGNFSFKWGDCVALLR